MGQRTRTVSVSDVDSPTNVLVELRAELVRQVRSLKYYARRQSEDDSLIRSVGAVYESHRRGLLRSHEVTLKELDVERLLELIDRFPSISQWRSENGLGDDLRAYGDDDGLLWSLDFSTESLTTHVNANSLQESTLQLDGSVEENGSLDR